MMKVTVEYPFTARRPIRVQLQTVTEAGGGEPEWHRSYSLH